MPAEFASCTRAPPRFHSWAAAASMTQDSRQLGPSRYLMTTRYTVTWGPDVAREHVSFLSRGTEQRKRKRERVFVTSGSRGKTRERERKREKKEYREEGREPRNRLRSKRKGTERKKYKRMMRC